MGASRIAPRLRFVDIPPDELTSIYAQVGELVVTASALDIGMSTLLSTIFDISDGAFSDIVIHCIDISKKREMIASFARSQKSDLLCAALLSLSTAVDEVFKDRNTVAHGTLFEIDGTKFIGSFGAPNRLKVLGLSLEAARHRWIE